MDLSDSDIEFIQGIYKGIIFISNINGVYYYANGEPIDMLKILLHMAHIDNEVKDLIDGTT